MADEFARSSRAWMLWSLFGIGAWIGVTVLVTVIHDDPSDPAPVLRTFALAGGVFFAVTFGVAGLQMRRRRVAAGAGLYRRLAVRAVSDDDLRAGARAMAGIGPTYLFFGATVTGLMLAAIGLGDEDLLRLLLYAAVGLVAVWAVYALFALRRAYAASDAFVEPLGLRLTEVPSWVSVPSGGGTLVGAMGYGGERGGREVVITQTPGGAVTALQGTFGERRLTDPARLAALTGEPWSAFRRVTATSGPDGIVVERAGNGAGRWMLTDLLLAESLAADTPGSGA